MSNPLSRNNWCTITGAPSSGKTTVIEALKRLGYRVVPESARAVLDERLAQGMSIEQARGSEDEFQERIFQHKLRLHAAEDPKSVSFFDRGMHDLLAYIFYYRYPRDPRIDKAMEDISYNHVFLLEPLPDFVPEPARVEGPDFSTAITPLLHQAYSLYGMPPIRVPVMSVDDRVSFILSHT
jgi:predicted ATPase